MDGFDTVEERDVIPKKVLAAGMLYYACCVGELLSVFKLADAVMLRCVTGAIQLRPGETSVQLYLDWKRRDERMSSGERAILYRRVLNMGDGQQLDGAVANEAFPELWGALMQAVADYIGNAEAKATLVESNLSKERIYQATKQLRLNLTRFVNGIAQMQMTEISQQLQAALAILQNPQIVDLFGSGRQKNIQTVIERASKEWFDYRPNISAIRSLAVNGYGVFNWIARFDQTTVTDEQFNTFLVAAESWILAQAEAGGEAAVVTNSGDSDTKGSDNRSSTDSDDFDRDWSL